MIPTVMPSLIINITYGYFARYLQVDVLPPLCEMLVPPIILKHNASLSTWGPFFSQYTYITAKIDGKESVEQLIIDRMTFIEWNGVNIELVN